MPFGPIIDAELTRLSRQRRWYVLRFALGLGLILLLYQAYEWARHLPWGSAGAEDWVLRMAASNVLYITMVGQSVVVVFLAPMLAAGAIAEEKQRKTLHYLLASRLSSLEIVLGKLAARLLLVTVPIAMAVPVVVIAMILGGFPSEILLAFYGAMLTTALFEASLALLISTLASRGREALLITFLVGLAWFVGPVLVKNLMTGLLEPWPSVYYRWIDPINTPLTKLTPLDLVESARRVTPTTLPSVIGTMMAHQVVGAAVLLGLSAWRLRPAFRRQGGPSPRSRAGRFLTRRWFPRRPVGDDPMLWKETHGTPGSRLVALVSLLASLTVVVFGYDSLKDSIPRSWHALREHGYRVVESDPRHVLNVELRVSTAGLFGVWGLLLMIGAATSISREREDDTWISLISTPLPGRAILGAKLVGTAWSARHLAYAILGLIAFGTAMGAFHPLGALIGVAQMAAFGLFIVAAGTLISLRARTTSFAIGTGVILLVVLDLILPLMIEAVRTNDPGPSAFVTSQPVLLGCGLLSYSNFEEMRSAYSPPLDDRLRAQTREAIRTIAGGSLAYLALGPVLLAWAYRRFDRALDRPLRAVTSDAPAHPTSAARGADERASLPAGRA